MSDSARYAQSGVDIDAAQSAVDLMKDAIHATHSHAVLADVGSFGGLFALTDLPANPVLVASTDGVGTKVKLAADAGAWRGIGHDIVNHCVNDILVQNARPLFFLDYVAAGRLVPERVADVVIGIAEACRAVDCALLGGETAEMPGVYHQGAFDVAGTVVGLVDRNQLLPRTEAMQVGDSIIGLPSSGPHTNGYSLIRQVVEGRDLDAPMADGRTLLQALLAPHRCYLAEVDRLLAAGIEMRGLAHITGGGLIDNVPRILPDGLAARLDTGAWSPPQIFQMLMNWAEMSFSEAFRVFNMGIGMVAVVPASAQRAAIELIPGAIAIGSLTERGAGHRPVQFD